MDCFQVQDSEKAELALAWKKVYLTTESVTKEYKTYPGLFRNWGNIMRENTLHIPSLISRASSNYRREDVDGSFILPGLPGYQDVHLNRIADIMIEITTQYQTLGTLLGDELAKEIEKTVQCRDLITNDQKIAVKTARHSYKLSRNAAFKSTQQLNALHRDLLALYNKGDQKKLCNVAEKYAQLLSQTKYLIDITNFKYSYFIQKVKFACEVLKEMEAARSQMLLSSFERVLNTFSSAAANYEMLGFTLQQNISDLHGNWVDDFASFCLKAGINRGKLDITDMEPFKFSFVDMDLISNVSKKSRVTLDPPLMFAEALVDFDGDGESELSIKKGDRLFLFEPAISRWVLASKTPDRPAGFIPSSSIRILRAKTAIACTIKLPESGDFVGLIPGELLVVLEKGKHMSKVEKLDGTLGMVYNNDVVFE